jgi:hypothetical protein
MSRIAAETQQWSAIDLAASIETILREAKPAHGLRKVLHKHHDAAEIHRRLDVLLQATQLLGQRMDSLANEQASIAAALELHVAVLAVCVSMPSSFADVLQRRVELFAQADRECQLAVAQIEALRKDVREGILRLDEVRNVTIPAMGL